MRFVSNYACEHVMLLAPLYSAQAANIGALEVDALQHNYFLRETQRLRGRIYLQDGAIEPKHLSRDGRLVHPQDEHSWHLVLMSPDRRVSGCLRYVPHEAHTSFSELGVARSALAYSPAWGSRLRGAVESARAKARNRGMGYAEIGGWALSEELRHTAAALRICLNMYGLMKLLGGAMAIATATVRHQSSSILRKLGGKSLVSDGDELPSYYDAQYECEMEILGFDSEYPAQKYEKRIDECQENLAQLNVICAPALIPEYAAYS